MSFSDDFNKGFNYKTQACPFSKISNETLLALKEFKKEVETPTGVIKFFEDCSEINFFTSEKLGLAFDIINGKTHVIYYIEMAGRNRIDFVITNCIFTGHFAEDEYFNKFLTMLMGAVVVSNLKNKQ